MQLLKALSDSTSDVLFVKDTESRLMFVNPAAEKAIGKPRTELIGRNERDWLANREEAEIMIANDRSVIESGEPQTFEETLHGTRAPLRNETGAIIGVIGINRDVTEQRRNETALRISEHRFRRLFETRMIGLAFWTADGRVLDANDTILDTLGFTREDLKAGIDWRKLTPPEFHERDDQAIREIAEKGHSDPYEKILITKRGNRVPVLIASGSLESPQNSNIAVLFDITKLREAETKIQENEARLTAVMENLPEGVYMAGPNGEPLYANSMIERIWGSRPMLPASEYMQYKGWSRTTGTRYKSEDWPLARALKGESVRDEMIDIATFDDKCKIISVSANPVRGNTGENFGAVSITADVTELENQRRWLESVIDAIPTPVVLIERTSGQVILHNKAADKLTGGNYPQDPNQIFTETTLEDESGKRISSDKWPRVRAALGEHIEGELVYWTWREFKAPLLVYAHPLGAMFGRSDTVVIIYLDITRLKETEHQLRRAIQTRDDVLSIVSHDLKNPLSAINLTADLLNRSSIPQDQLIHLSRRIKQSASRMLGLISNLLDIASIESGSLEISPTVCSVRQAMAPVLEEMRTIADSKRIHLVEDIKCPDEALVCDVGRMSQVFSNIIGNALKFAPDTKGEVTVTGRCIRDRFVVSIRDNGPGVSQEDLPHIFDRFWHAKQTGKAGAGLGLAIAKGVVKAHKADISVSSETGRGAEFTFSIPTMNSEIGRTLLKKQENKAA